jgi:hypothetical protein
MKKIIVTALIAVMGIGAQAQLVSTTSAFEEVFKEKKVRVKPRMEWYVKAGINLMSINWDEDPLGSFYRNVTISGGGKMLAGFNVGGGLISYFRPSRPSDFYWGFEVGVSQVGGGFDSMTGLDYGYNSRYEKYANGSSARFFSVYVGPSIGWKKALTSNISLDLHFNPEFLIALGDGPDILYNTHYEYSYYDYYDDKTISYSDTYNSTTYVYKDLCHLAMRGGIGVWFNKFNVDLSYRGTVKISDYVSFNNIILSVGYAF